MALEELRSFIQGRLQAYDPSIDVSDGSPADTEVVEPIIARLGTQPFDIDTVTFIKQRIQENFDIDTDGEFEDLFVNPLQTLIEPLVQEQQRIANNQSLNNINLMSDEEVDDHAANSFARRESGSKATTFVRLYYPNPVNLVITTDKAARTSSGLQFFAVENSEVASSQMLLNREGFEYFADIFVQAEDVGDQYNVDPGQINQFDDMRNPLRVTNKFKAVGGSNSEPNTAFIQRIEDGRIEQSLNTKRGAVARTTDLFPSVRAVQVVGAGEIGMDRDILDGTSDGLVYFTFSGGSLGNWVYLDVSSGFNDIAQTIIAGDLIKFKTTTASTIYKSKVVQILFTGTGKYILQLEDSFPSIYGSPIVGVLYKEGFITISKIPGGMLNATVPSNTVHLGGHDDVYIAPTDDQEQDVTVKNIIDQEPFFSTTTGAVVIDDNKFSTSPVTDWTLLPVRVGDSLIIETGASVGTYDIIYVDSTVIRVNKLFTATESSLRARILKYITFDIDQPKNVKVPFSGTATDLSVSVGSKLFITTQNLQSFGVIVGDSLEILSGPNLGTYTITAFDTVLGGTGPIVDRAATFTQTNVPYRVYSSQPGLQIPFVRIKTIDILDSSNQTTNSIVPFGDLVDARISCEMESDGEPEVVLDKKLFFVPDFIGFTPIAPDPSFPAAFTDARYTQRIASYDGVIRKVDFDISNPILEAEINLPPFVYNGFRDTVIALVSKEDKNFTNDPANNAQTSPLAEAKIGDLLTVTSGPNSDAYVIEDLRVLELWGKSVAGHFNVALAKLDKEIRIDPVGNIISLINYGIAQGSGVPAFTFNDYFKIFDYAPEFFLGNGFIMSVLVPRLASTMGYLGFAMNLSEAEAFIRDVCFCSYTVGPAPEGEMECYTKEPVTVEIYTKPVSTNDNPNISITTFTELLDSTIDTIPKKVQVKTNLPPGQIFPQSFAELDISQYDRSASTNYPADDYLYLTNGNFISQGVRDGDVLEFYPAINDYSSRHVQDSSFLLVTNAGSNEVTFIWPTTRNNVTPLRAGQILTIDTGPDAGTYLVTDVIVDTSPNHRVRINKSLTHTTLVYPTHFGYNATVTSGLYNVFDVAIPGSIPNGYWMTVYAATSTGILTSGEDEAYLGTFSISGMSPGSAVLDRTSPFPANASVYWIAHTAPAATPPATSGGGTELSTQYVRGRLYSEIKELRDITIDWTVTPNPFDPTSTQQIKLDSSITTASSIINFSHKSPYRIIRDGVMIISSTELQKTRENGLYKFTVPIIALGTSPEYLFERGHPFRISDSYRIEGYRHIVDNEVLTFSDLEKGSLRLPVSILPTGSTYSKDNYLNLGGSNLKFTYEASPTVEAVQQFFSSPLDRVTCNNALVRHFLPAYPYIEVTYVGGEDTDAVGQDIIAYINTLIAEDNQIRADKINDVVKKRLASQVKMPIELVALVHGIDRNIRTLRSEDSIGILDVPIYKGVPRAIIFFSGKDVSKELTIPDVEYIKCTRQ